MPFKFNPITGKLDLVSPGGGGSGITTINGDTGSATGATVTFDASTNAGSTVSFAASGSTVSLKVSDLPTLNTIIGESSGNGAISGSFNTGLGTSVFTNLTSGLSNTAIGVNALLTVTTGSGNTAIGANALGIGTALTGDANVAIGYAAMQGTSITTASRNTVIGAAAYQFATVGTDNICLGYQAGAQYSTNESSNICIGNDGDSLDNNRIRIGTQGTGTGQQNQCFIAGVAGSTITSPNVVMVNTSTGQIGATSFINVAQGGTGTTSFNINGVVISNTNSTGPLDSLTLANGQVVIGSTGATPVAANLTAGTNIAITNGAGSISIAVSGTPLINTYTNVSTTPYVVLSTDYYLYLDTSGGAKTLQFPNAPTTNRTFIIKDRTGNSTANNITLTTVGGAVLIDGATSQLINNNYGAVNLLFNGTTYERY